MRPSTPANETLAPAMNAGLAQLLIRSARAMPERSAVFAGTEVHASYAELADRAARAAHGLLAQLGLRRGDRVALAIGNCPQYVELMFAIWHAGLCAVPINAKLHGREIAYILDHSGARACFVDLERMADLAVEGASRVPLVAVDDAQDYEALFGFSPLAAAPAGDEDIAWLFYTSGTTGRPKGAMLSHRNLLAMTRAHGDSLGAVSCHHRLIHAAPMSHGSGLYLLPYVAAGAAQVIPASGGFDVVEMLDLIDAHPGCRFFAAPTMLRRLVEHLSAHDVDTGNLDLVICGGAPLYLDDMRKALACLGSKIAQIYGQGETPMTITALSAPEIDDALGAGDEALLSSVGVACGGIELRIADANDEALPAGSPGEVLVRGATVMSGYWNNAEATTQALRNGWLHTGDIGVLDPRGFLTLKDRSKDVIISGGSNIYPREVEEVLLAHPDVVDAVVMGRYHPDWGEEVIAILVLRPGEALDKAALNDWCGAHIARFKRPKDYLQLEHLPKNSTGKVLRTELRQMLASGDLATV